MINQSTLDSLKAMRLTAMAVELERQLEDAATYRFLGFEERIGLLVDAEWKTCFHSQISCQNSAGAR